MGAYNPPKRRLWEEHLRKWKASGVSQVEYCRLNDVNVKSFRYWKRRIGRLGCAPALVELPVTKSIPLNSLALCPQFCLVVGQHYRIEIGKGFDSEDLERVVRALGRV